MTSSVVLVGNRYVAVAKELKAIKKEHNAAITEMTALKTEIATVRQQAGEADRLMHGLVAANEKYDNLTNSFNPAKEHYSEGQCEA